MCYGAVLHCARLHSVLVRLNVFHQSSVTILISLFKLHESLCWPEKTTHYKGHVTTYYSFILFPLFRLILYSLFQVKSIKQGSTIRSSWFSSLDFYLPCKHLQCPTIIYIFCNVFLAKHLNVKNCQDNLCTSALLTNRLNPFIGTNKCLCLVFSIRVLFIHNICCLKRHCFIRCAIRKVRELNAVITDLSDLLQIIQLKVEHCDSE